jgi:hypothetical protein
MSARLAPAKFYSADGFVAEDFETMATGVITSLPAVTGVGGLALEEGPFTPRI